MHLTDLVSPTSQSDTFVYNSKGLKGSCEGIFVFVRVQSWEEWKVPLQCRLLCQRGGRLTQNMTLVTHTVGQLSHTHMHTQSFSLTQTFSFIFFLKLFLRDPCRAKMRFMVMQIATEWKVSSSACGRRPAALIDTYIHVNDLREVPWGPLHEYFSVDYRDQKWTLHVQVWLEWASRYDPERCGPMPLPLGMNQQVNTPWNTA